MLKIIISLQWYNWSLQYDSIMQNVSFKCTGHQKYNFTKSKMVDGLWRDPFCIIMRNFFAISNVIVPQILSRWRGFLSSQAAGWQCDQRYIGEAVGPCGTDCQMTGVLSTLAVVQCSRPPLARTMDLPHPLHQNCCSPSVSPIVRWRNAKTQSQPQTHFMDRKSGNSRPSNPHDPFLLRLRSGFCRPLYTFINYIYLLLATNYQN